MRTRGPAPAAAAAQQDAAPPRPHSGNAAAVGRGTPTGSRCAPLPLDPVSLDPRELPTTKIAPAQSQDAESRPVREATAIHAELQPVYCDLEVEMSTITIGLTD